MQPTLSRSTRDKLFFHTQTTWKAELDDQGDATHHLVIKVFDPEYRHPITNLSINLPASGVYEDFVTEVDGRTLLPGTGYIETASRYTISLSEILGDNPAASVNVSFKQRRAWIKMGGMSLLLWPFGINLHGSVDLDVVLPPIRGYQRLLTWIHRFLEKKPPYYVIHQIDLPPLNITAHNLDPRRGIIKYLLRDGTVIPGFAFEGYSSLTLYTVVGSLVGLIIAIIEILAFVLR
jgi:hypothetical protein